MSNIIDSIDDQYCYQLIRICTSYHRIRIENIYKIINTLVYHLIYNEKFNDYPFKESLIQQILIELFKRIKSNTFHFVLDSYKEYIHNEVWKHKQLKNEQDNEKNNRSKCCKSCI
jgi:hypothetical protein